MTVSETNEELVYLERISADATSRLNRNQKLPKLPRTSRKRVAEQQSRSFFSTKKRAAKRESWKNPSQDEKLQIEHDLDDIVVID